MQATKHDLSHDSTKLDYQALVKTAGIAVALSKERVHEHLNKLYNFGLNGKRDLVSLELNSQWLCRAAEQLQVSAETYATLLGGLDRHELEIINKPEIEEEM